jgi:hypothetical protein
MLFFTRNVVIDEKMLDKYENYRDVSQIYNQLRKNYESRLAFDEASNFLERWKQYAKDYVTERGRISSRP